MNKIYSGTHDGPAALPFPQILTFSQILLGLELKSLDHMHNKFYDL